MVRVYLLWREGPNYDGGDQLEGVYFTPPSRLEIARRDLMNRSTRSVWKNGNPRPRRPYPRLRGFPGRISFGDYRVEETEVLP